MYRLSQAIWTPKGSELMTATQAHWNALKIAFDDQHGYSLVPGIGENCVLTRWGNDGFRRAALQTEVD